MSEFKGDFLGFSYNGVHSSKFNIVRTSDGSRFNENLLPSMQDRTVQIPGGDGTYYFGSYYTQKDFDVSFAFDSLTEEQLSKFKKWLGDRQIHPLVFDEMPYKEYQAKVTSLASIKYIPFSEGTTQRIYKGEGSIQFTCYKPFARSCFKFLDQSIAENKKEWQAASGMLETQGKYDTLSENGYSIPLYNPGDLPASMKLTLKGVDKQISHFSCYLESDATCGLEIEAFELTGNDEFVLIDFEKNLLEGLDSQRRKTGNTYNQFLSGGNFFTIPNLKREDALIFSQNMQPLSPEVDYKYRYF